MFQPSNILFSLDGIVKVGDFGLVTDINRQTDCCQQSTFSQVPANHTADVGTQLYMSPEQVNTACQFVCSRDLIGYLLNCRSGHVRMFSSKSQLGYQFVHYKLWYIRQNSSLHCH